MAKTIGIAEKTVTTVTGRPPILVLIAGATAVGKSTTAVKLTSSRSFSRLLSTDAIREIMRVVDDGSNEAMHVTSDEGDARLKVSKDGRHIVIDTDDSLSTWIQLIVEMIKIKSEDKCKLIPGPIAIEGLCAVNIGESQLANSEELTEPVSLELEEKAEVISACIQLEAEAAELPLDEQADLLEGLGLGEGALPRFVKQAYHILGLRTFLTTGEKESRAWTFRDGSTAPEAAGRIHTDFQKGFIRAETINWESLLECGSWVEARESGKIRVEGKDYIVQDGDVMEFRFNV